MEPEPVRAVAPAPVARVHRSRLAFAVAVTLAALPVVVLDNLSATADPPVQVGAVATASTGARGLVRPSTTSSSRPSTTTEAPTTTDAPTTTEAPTTTARVATTAPPATAPPVTSPPPTSPPAASPPTTSPPAPTAGDPDDPVTWDQMALCESGGNWSLDTGNGYYGGLQFSLGTWQGVGGVGNPSDATPAEQILRGKILQARAGWGQWPYCASLLGFL